MSSFVPGIPLPSEYAPAFGRYVGKAEQFTAPIDRLESQLSEVLSLLESLDETKQLYRYAPGKWSVKEVVGHLIDAERIFSYRALRIARTDVTPLPGFDENSYVASADTDSIHWGELLEEFEQVRCSTMLMLRHIPVTAWERVGTSNNAPLSVRALAYVMIGHVEHHMELLKERYGLA